MLRVVRISDFDVEACAGTHTEHTNDLGMIKIINCERIQDGVERLEFTAGLATLDNVQKRDRLVKDTCDVVSVMPEQLPKTMTRFFGEWKSQKKEIEALRKEMAEGMGKGESGPEQIGSVNVTILEKNFDKKGLINFAQGMISNPNTLVVIGSISDGRGTVLIARSKDVDVHCGEVLKETLASVDGKGGGRADFAQGGIPDITKLETALESARTILQQKLE